MHSPTVLSTFLPSLFVVFLTTPAIAAPAPAPSLSDAIENLQAHVEKLASLKTRSCPADYRRFNKEMHLRIGLFMGYANFEPEVDDPINAKAFAKVLVQPCPPNVGACGFHQVAAAPQAVLLRKSLGGGRDVEIEIRHSALTTDNDRNMGPLARQQDFHSADIRNHFNEAIGYSDMVLYMGHARYGGGMGFFPARIVDEALNIVFQNPLRGTLEALQRTKRLKAFGLLACETEGHYRAELEEANSNIDLILSKKIMEMDSVSQTGLGAIDSILRQRCAPELISALTTERDATDEDGHPTGGKEAMSYIHSSVPRSR